MKGWIIRERLHIGQMEGLKDAAAVADAVRSTSLSGDEKNTAELKGCVRAFSAVAGVSITVASFGRRSV